MTRPLLWLEWLCAPRDGPILVLLAVVLVALSLGLWSRRARDNSGLAPRDEFG